MDDIAGLRVRRGLIALAGAWLLGGAPPAPAQFAVSPVLMELPFDESGANAAIRIDNEGDATLHFRVYSRDFDQDRTGDHAFRDAGSTTHSCADRLSFAPDALTVPAGGRATVRVRLAPGGPAAPTCWSMLFVEAPARSTSNIRVNQRIGVKVYGLGAQTGSGGELISARSRTDGGSVIVALSLRNPGDRPLRPSGTVEVRDAMGHLAVAREISPFSILPRHEREMIVALPVDTLPAGRYMAIPILDLGGDHLAGAQLDFRLTD